MVRRKRQDRAGGELGSFTVELVLLAPVLVVFALVAMGLGRYELAREQVIAAARAAAEAASVAPSAVQAQTSASLAVTQDIEGRNRTCTDTAIETDTTDFVPGGIVRVTITCEVNFADLMVPGLPGSATFSVVQVAPIDPYRSVQ